MTRDMGMEEVLPAPRSPWQNPFVERLVGSIRREMPGPRLGVEQQILASNSAVLFRLLRELPDASSLAKDGPLGRPVQTPTLGKMIEIPQLGGLHHLYIRNAA